MSYKNMSHHVVRGTENSRQLTFKDLMPKLIPFTSHLMLASPMYLWPHEQHKSRWCNFIGNLFVFVNNNVTTKYDKQNLKWFIDEGKDTKQNAKLKQLASSLKNVRVQGGSRWFLQQNVVNSWIWIFNIYFFNFLKFFKKPIQVKLITIQQRMSASVIFKNRKYEIFTAQWCLPQSPPLFDDLCTPWHHRFWVARIF